MWGKKLLSAAVFVAAILAFGVSTQAQFEDPFVWLDYGVQPGCPFDCDSVVLWASGELTSTSWRVPVLTGWNRNGQDINVFFDVYFDPGPTLPVTVPFELSVPIGVLPEAAYIVTYTFSIINPIATMPVIQTIIVTDEFRVAPPGDQTCDGSVDPRDVIRLVNYVFRGDLPPDPLRRADINCDGATNVIDVVKLVIYVYRVGTICDPCGPGGRFLGSSGCKTFMRTAIADSVPPDQDCMEYQYDGQSVLLLKHVNAGFNCCPEWTFRIQVANSEITIEEIEIAGLCDCLCLFDLDFEITNLPPGNYAIRVVEPYAQPGDEPLEFVVDLGSSPSGNYCVSRNHYPWGTQ